MEDHPQAAVVAGFNTLCGPLGEYLNAQGFDFLFQQLAAFAIYLHGHQSWGELHHSGVQVQPAQRVGGFQTEQAATHDHAVGGVFGRCLNGIQVIQGAVNQAAFAVVAGNGRHKGKGAGGQHELVIRVVALFGHHQLLFAVNRGDRFAAA